MMQHGALAINHTQNSIGCHPIKAAERMLLHRRLKHRVPHAVQNHVLYVQQALIALGFD